MLTLTQLTNTYVAGAEIRNRETTIDSAPTAADQAIPNIAIYAASKVYALPLRGSLGDAKRTQRNTLGLRYRNGVITTTFHARGKQKNRPG